MSTFSFHVRLNFYSSMFEVTSKFGIRSYECPCVELNAHFTLFLTFPKEMLGILKKKNRIIVKNKVFMCQSCQVKADER